MPDNLDMATTAACFARKMLARAQAHTGDIRSKYLDAASAMIVAAEHYRDGHTAFAKRMMMRAELEMQAAARLVQT